jgi:hypothetical protein
VDHREPHVGVRRLHDAVRGAGRPHEDVVVEAGRAQERRGHPGRGERLLAGSVPRGDDVGVAGGQPGDGGERREQDDVAQSGPGGDLGEDGAVVVGHVQERAVDALQRGAHRCGVGQVALDRGDVRGQVGLGRIADQGEDLVAAAGEQAGDVATDGSGGAGDEDLHGGSASW